MKLNLSQFQFIATVVSLAAALSGCGNSAPSAVEITQVLNKKYTVEIENAKGGIGISFGRMPTLIDHVEINQCLKKENDSYFCSAIQYPIVSNGERGDLINYYFKKASDGWTASSSN
jgi:hypothetical protein